MPKAVTPRTPHITMKSNSLTAITPTYAYSGRVGPALPFPRRENEL